MRVIGLLAVFSLAICLGPPAHAKIVQIDGRTYDVATPGEFIPGEVIVQARPQAMGTGPQAFQQTGLAIAARVGGSVKATIPRYNLYLIKLAPLPAATASKLTAQKSQISSALQALQQSPLVKTAVYNYKQSIFPPVKGGLRAGSKLPVKATPAPKSQVPPLGLTPSIMSMAQWHLDRIKFWQAGDPPATAPLIAVVDTGVDYTHPDLTNPIDKVIKGRDFYNNDNDPMDDNSHGTHVAGIAAANSASGVGVMGVSPTSRILAVKVFPANGGAGSFTVWQGFTYARDYPEVKVINYSGGGWAPEDSAFYDLEKSIIDDIVLNKKIVFVCAAGNDYDLLAFQSEGFENYRPIPAWYPNALTVAASEQEDFRTYFSNYNLGTFNGLTFNYTFVKMVAPGWEILSTTPVPRSYGSQPWNPYYDWYSGTSMASPVIAGAAARYLVKSPAATPAQVLNNLKVYGRALTTTYGWYSGEKRVDLMKLMGINVTGFTGAVYSGSTGRPLSGVTVEVLLHTGGTVMAGTATGPDGFFTVTGLTGGTVYDIRFSKTKYSTFTFNNFGPGLTATANYLVDLPQAVSLRQTVPGASQWSLMITWNSWQPGYRDATVEFTPPNWTNPFIGKPPWYPFYWYNSAGTYFTPRLKLPNGTTILHTNNPGNRFSPTYYSQMTADPWMANYDTGNFTSTPVANFIITQLLPGADPYKLYCNLNNGADPLTYYEWGNYPASKAVAYLYKGNTLVATVPVSAATLTGSTNNWWYIASINNVTNTQTVVNTRQDTEP